MGARLENYKSRRGSPAQKVTFCGAQFRRPPLGASEGPRGEFWSVFWRFLGPLFVLSDRGFAHNLKKQSYGVFFTAQTSGLQS